MTKPATSGPGDSGTGPTVFLHVGTPKSGTTYLQSRFANNADRALEQGLLWPGPRWGVHVDAVRDLRTLRRSNELSPDGPWMRLAEQARSWGGPKVLISMEWLSGCRAEHAARAIATLSPARVEIICTARDLLRSFVAQWQEMTKNCHPWSWSMFVEEILEDKGGDVRRRFWNQQDVPEILRKWAKQVPWDRIHLVTVPPRGADPELLWQRFCSVLQIDGSDFEQPPRDNESLGVVSAELMYRVNLAAIEQSLSHDEYQRVMHLRLADQVLAPHRSQEQPITVAPHVDAWIRQRADTLIEDLRGLKVDLVGDLDDLVPREPLTGREPTDVTDDELLTSAVRAIVALGMNQYHDMQLLRAANADLKRRLKALRKRTGGEDGAENVDDAGQ